MDISYKCNFKWKKQFEEYIAFSVNILSLPKNKTPKFDHGYLWEEGLEMKYVKSTQGASTVLNMFYLTRYGYRGTPYIAQKNFFNPRKKTLRSKTKDDIF